MTRIYIILFALMITVAPAMAQEAVEKNDAVAEEVVSGDAVEGDAETVQSDTGKVSLPTDYEERLKLAREMHEIWPIRLKVEQAIEMISRRVMEGNRPAFKSKMRKVIEFDALEKASIDAMAEIYTAKELQAMVKFYGSEEGRSINIKNSDYEEALKPALSKMLDKGMLDTKLGR